MSHKKIVARIMPTVFAIPSIKSIVLLTAIYSCANSIKTPTMKDNAAAATAIVRDQEATISFQVNLKWDC